MTPRMLAPLRVVLFDLDGTLIDSTQLITHMEGQK